MNAPLRAASEAFQIVPANYLQRTSESATLEVAVSFGPDVGSRWRLINGSYSIGRDQSCDWTFKDPLLDRLQLQISVQSGQIKAHSLGNKACLLNGKPVSEGFVLVIGDRLQIGTSELFVRRYFPEPKPHSGGKTLFHRSPYFPTPVEEVILGQVGSVPELPEQNKLAFIALILPLILGIVMSILLGQPRYLLFSLLSPIVAVANHYEQKRRRKGKYGDEIQRFEDRFKQLKSEVREAVARERFLRHTSSPSLLVVAEMATQRSSQLWVRDRSSEDFLSLRLGIGSVASSISIDLQPGGSDELHAEILSLHAFAKTLDVVPFTLSLRQHSVLGILHSSTSDVAGLANALLLQAVCLHSPTDLVVFSIIGYETHDFIWLKDLPHVNSPSSPLSADHVAEDSITANALLKEMILVAETRTSKAKNGIRNWPWLLCVVDARCGFDPVLIEQLLNLVPEASMSILWLADEQAVLPRQVQVLIKNQSVFTEKRSTAHFTDYKVKDTTFIPERVTKDILKRVSSSLSPLCDASAMGASATMPRQVSLYETLEVSDPSTLWLKDRWASNADYSLRTSVGVNESGVVSFDLVSDGPHALVGGTSGSGKSEFLSALVAGLVANYGPDRVNFLFVDYKGGASSDQFLDLIHTVGYVTNLDGSLTVRALTSLRAELDSRMSLLKKHKAKSMDILYKTNPDLAPPSLVIIVDEFATLIKEVPEFIDGIVDISQRGRSLGIHLVLATQRPAGAVNENILANTNLRVCLRMIDDKDSKSVIGSVDAAAIPAPLKGRAFVRIGQKYLSVFQSAWCGVKEPQMFEDFFQSEISDKEAATQLDKLISLVANVSTSESYTAGPPPWREMLADKISISHFDRAAFSADLTESQFLLGLSDVPEKQDQSLSAVDFSLGALLIFGAGGSGKTLAIRSLIASADTKSEMQSQHCVEGGPVAPGYCFFGLDFSNRQLVDLEVHPHCVAIGSIENFESVTRIISSLYALYERRRNALGAEKQSSETKVFLFIDGYDNLIEEMERPRQDGLHKWLDQLHRLLLDGRQVGIFSVVTTTRRAAVRSSLMASTSNKLVLKQVEIDRYNEFGISRKQVEGMPMPPGRGFLHGNRLVQILFPEDLPQDRTKRVPKSLLTEPLPENISLGSISPERTEILTREFPLKVILGVEDLTLSPVTIDLSKNNFGVIGMPRSGRSTVLSCLIQQMLEKNVTLKVVCPTSSPLMDSVDSQHVLTGSVEDISSNLLHFCNKSEKQRFVIIDDVDIFPESQLDACWRFLLSMNIPYVASASRIFGYSTNPLLQDMKRLRNLFYMQPASSRELQECTTTSVEMRPGLKMVPGRGVLFTNGQNRIIQAYSNG